MYAFEKKTNQILIFINFITLIIVAMSGYKRLNTYTKIVLIQAITS